MSSKLVKMRVANFGCFDAEGVTVALDNIVCLVGLNNCGKSTILRAYEAAVTCSKLRSEDFHKSEEVPATVELWVHIPENTPQISEEWKVPEGNLLLVRSKWEWSKPGDAPVRTTWDPASDGYSEDAKASGLDQVFGSRLPQPYRIGSLQDPKEEHKLLLKLLLDPLGSTLKAMMEQEGSSVKEKLAELKAEAQKPVDDYREQVKTISARVQQSYGRVFSSAMLKFDISLGDFKFDPVSSLSEASSVTFEEHHGEVKWHQQGTGSQRALFWSMLEVRSELKRAEEARKGRTAKITDCKKKIAKLESEKAKVAKDDTKAKKAAEIAELEAELKTLEDGNDNVAQQQLLPGYMLLIDEPETALHPSAVRAAKEHLYSLAEENGWQVMLSTHHPAFIDPLKDNTTIVRLHRPDQALSPRVYRAQDIALSDDEKAQLKALMVFDATVSEMFFANKAIIVEGDTEFAAFSEIMNSNSEKYPIETRPLILRARGKAPIATLVRMLSHFKIDMAVLHDTDAPRTSCGSKKSSAYGTNKTISDAIEEARKQVRVIYRVSVPNFELQHGLELTEKEKPYSAWKTVRESDEVRNKVTEILDCLLDFANCDQHDKQLDGSNYDSVTRAWAVANANGDLAKAFQFENSNDAEEPVGV